MERANAKTVYYVDWEDLPLSCPMPQMTLWNSHQRVYLPIHRSGREQCPYCGAVYILQDPDPGEEPPQLANIEVEQAYHRARRRLGGGSASGRMGR